MTSKFIGQARQAFGDYLQQRREDGWTDAQLAGLRNAAHVVMTWDDGRLLALYPAGLFGSADEVRESFVGFWSAA